MSCDNCFIKWYCKVANKFNLGFIDYFTGEEILRNFGTINGLVGNIGEFMYVKLLWRTYSFEVNFFPFSYILI